MFYFKNGKLKFRVDTRSRYRTDLKFNLSSRMSHLIRHSLKENKAGRGWKTLVEYSLKDLVKRLEETMPKGYTWQDYMEGKLHIDHIIPVKAFIFKTPEDKEFKDCWDLHNLRLISLNQNEIKHFTIENPILLGLLIKYQK